MPTKTQNLVRSSLPGWCGLVALLASYYVLRNNDKPAYVNAVIIVGIMYAVVFCVEAAFCRSGHFGLIAAPSQRPFSLSRVTLKTVGLVITIFIVSSIYWLFPEYAGSFYKPYYQALALTWPYITLFFLTCVVMEDTRADKAEDDHYYIGLALKKGDFSLLKNVDLKQHFLKWLVKLYFLPLMFVYFVGYLKFSAGSQGVLRTYDIFYNHVFLVDCGITCMGYAFANNLIDTQIRSTEPTMLGWASALMCYQPFWSIFGKDYLAYGGSWGPWLSNYPTLQAIWAVLICLFLSLYIWASISFGSRFSNLTHRGILVCGPYAYLRHPAYIGKIGSFFLMYIPFVGADGLTVFRNLILWSMVAGVYVVRAKTEEAHLRSIGPEYDLYSQEVANNWKKLWT